MVVVVLVPVSEPNVLVVGCCWLKSSIDSVCIVLVSSGVGTVVSITGSGCSLFDMKVYDGNDDGNYDDDTTDELCNCNGNFERIQSSDEFVEFVLVIVSRLFIVPCTCNDCWSCTCLC